MRETSVLYWIFSVAVAAVLWFMMFSPWTAGTCNFWLSMSVSAVVLLLFSWGRFPFKRMSAKAWLKELGVGVILALLLWAVFWNGDKIASWLFGFARGQVDMIYGMKGDIPGWLISLLLLMLIGPAEEIFWRGYVQRTAQNRWGANRGYMVATLVYTLIHVWSGNFMLVMSALVCGVFWGGIYRFYPHRFGSVVMSHALRDAAVFVWFPIL